MTREQARQKAKELVSGMTIEEMASQLRFDAPAIPRLNIPEYNWWNEALHGVARAGAATVFPQAIGMAAMFDEDMMEKIGDAVAKEARAKYNAVKDKDDRDIYKGLTFWSPNVNIFRDPRWGRGHETFGEDPYLSGRLGVSYIKGLQGNGEYLKTAACAKHFAVHSGPEAKRHYFDAKVSKKEMHETYLPAFEACVKEAKVEAVMGAYNRTNGEACCAHTELIGEILRGKWGFEGHFVSDCWAVRDFHENHKITDNPRESAALALKKGCDLNCGCTYLCLVQAYNEKKITKEELKGACERLFTTRFLLGLFEEGGTEYDSVPYSVVECREHLELSRKAAEKSMVLLKNEDGFLPLKEGSLKSVGIIGPNANSRAALIGNYHGTASDYTTISEGIRAALNESDVRVYFSEGCHIYKEKTENLARENDRISEALVVADNSDVIVLVLGLDESLEGEEGDTGNSYASGDKENLEFPKSQVVLLDTLIDYGNKNNKPIVLVNMTGSAMNLSKAKESPSVKAIIQAFYPGAEGGKAFADILFGKVSPSGKLPITFYESSGELPDFDDYSMKGRTYRFMQTKAQYPFGFGLTYGDVWVVSADFSDGEKDRLHKDLKAGVSILEDSWYNIKVECENRGSVDTDEVIEVYIKDPGSELSVPNVNLCGFKRIFCKAGEKGIFEVKIPGKAFLEYDEKGERVLDSERFKLFIGFNGPDEVSTGLGKETIEIEVTV
ncbi:MAG: glycoside hydrolase family 3 C-terminal domain-containing protein [Lachnospiraceae bacterium]|nr:glycoside hydrolase family 3 C-terminal domain-containing protein [Lachnospiraceae bacterium]